MTETIRKEMPFKISWCYPPDDGEPELCDKLLIGHPDEASPLEIGITNILADKTIAIVPVGGDTKADSTNYHFQLKFNPGILVNLDLVTVESDNWSLHRVNHANYDSLYLLWKGKEEIRLAPEEATEIILAGKAAQEQPVNHSYSMGIYVNMSWQFLHFNEVRAASGNALPLNSSQDYYDYITLGLEMVKDTGATNIPLFVGFVNGNKVINTNDVTNSLLLRLTNTNITNDDSGSILFNYSSDPDRASELQVVLEVGTPEEAPWALGTEDQVNKISIQIQGWEQNGLEEVIGGGEVKGLRWRFVPIQELELKPQETMLIKFENIVTNHPSGDANLYLYYKNVVGYRDGKFCSQVEKVGGALKRGMIVIWYGENIPEGWQLCDGSTPGTPDLRGCFVRGMEEDEEGAWVSPEASEQGVTLERSHIPYHNHFDIDGRASETLSIYESDPEAYDDEERVVFKSGLFTKTRKYRRVPKPFGKEGNAIVFSARNVREVDRNESEWNTVTAMPQPKHAKMKFIMYVGND
ncbi:hypothetical protein [Okeania sp. SIO2B9]|uniref:hypothetical protein n=1 Tax=Okeania sp. SIO2B9 TaxID=2607782 RepID=UPI00142BFD83|nr:hypothetical protein [Okeania sp. SIO2B9]NES91678.1 tail fiber protein [Okeania sp. SIO2B9]